MDLSHSAARTLAFSANSRILASGGDDSTILLWDLCGQYKEGKLVATQLSSLWVDLAGPASKAHDAGWGLALNPEISTPFLKGKMQPVSAAPAEQIDKLIADLDGQQFAIRDKAAKALEGLGEAAEAAIRKALQSKITLEQRQRLELQLQMRVGGQLLKLRAIDVLERIGTLEARHVLEALAKSTPNPTVADAACTALARLEQPF
jgi:hypothetical protein